MIAILVVKEVYTCGLRSILDARYPSGVIIKLKTNYKNAYKNSELLCDNVEVIAEDLQKIMNY